jgi:catechol 2,3-dioxygenase-like lactoylglutathione lyase family enzyme
LVAIKHVNLGIPVDGADAETAFLVDVLGYRPVEPPAELKARFNPMWFEGEDGCEIHLSADPEHRPAEKAHVAVWLDDLSLVEQKLTSAGHEWTSEQYTRENTLRRAVFTTDPAGNRWELLGLALGASEATAVGTST